MATNTIGPFAFTQALMPSLLQVCIPVYLNELNSFYQGRKQKGVGLVFTMSTQAGSVSRNIGGWYTLRATKAALNMLVRTASIEFKSSCVNFGVPVAHSSKRSMVALFVPWSC